MSDIIDDVKSKLSNTSMADVANAGARAYRSAESTLRSGVDTAKKFVSDHTPDSIKEMYRRERGYTVRKPTPSRKITR